MASVTGLIGMVFDGRYKIVEMIGKGGMGAVYKATHIAMSQTVALKVLNPEALGDDTAVQRFYHEAKASSRLKHPNTIKVFDFGRSEEGHLYLAMEYLSGETLGALLRDEKVLSVGRTINMVKQVLKSLGEAHEQGLVHRDLKPDNIFLTEVFGETEFIKVLDFGISKFVDSSPEHETLTQAGLIPGTPLYVSPEQALGRPVDGTSDIYALGVIMYQMVTGRPPFRADSAVALVMKQIHDQPPDPNTINPNLVLPKRLKDLIFRMLNKEATKRPAKTLDIYQELEAIEKEGGYPDEPSKDLVQTGDDKDTVSQLIPNSTEVTSGSTVDHESPTTYITEQEENPAEMKTQFIKEASEDDLAEQPTSFITTSFDGEEADATIVDDSLARQIRRNRKKPWLFLIGLIIAIGLGIGLYLMQSAPDLETNTPPIVKKTKIRPEKKAVLINKPVKSVLVKTKKPVPVKSVAVITRDVINRSHDTNMISNKPRKPVIIASVEKMLNVNSRPSGAVVRVNGKAVGKTPLVYKLPAGAGHLKIVTSMKDYIAQTKTVSIDKSGRPSVKNIEFSLTHIKARKTKKAKPARFARGAKKLSSHRKKVGKSVKAVKKAAKPKKRHHKKKKKLDWEDE